MAKIVQMNLWNGTGIEMMPDPCEDIENVFFGTSFTNICERCELREFCDEENCARKGYEIDIDHDPSYDGTFEEWLSEPW